MKKWPKNEATNQALDRRGFLKISTAGSALLMARGSAASGTTLAASQEGSQPTSVQAERRRRVVTSLRTYLSGFHNGPTVTFGQLNPEEYMRKVRESHSDVVMIFTKDHWGYAYYDTKVGVRHPNLQYDLVRRWLDAGHRNGLSVVAYYSGQPDTQSGLKYPYWIGRNADGSPSWIARHFAWCCHHSPYHDYALGMYHELFSGYDFDGLFIDGLPWLRWLPDPLCYCEWCMARYEKDRGESFIEGLQEQEGYRKRIEWFQESSLRYLDEIFHAVHSQRPGVPIYFNQAGPFVMNADTLRKTSCLFLEDEGYDTFSGLSVASIVLRDCEMPGPQVLIYWEGYDGAPKEVDKFRTAAILSQGARPIFVTDQQNLPDGRQRQGFFDWTRYLQEYVSEVEPFLAGLKPVTSLGVLFSEATRDYLFAQRAPTTPFEGPTELIDSIVGCLELLSRTGYPVGIIPSWQLDSEALRSYDLIALPEVDSLSESWGSALQDYVRTGGMLLASWKPGLVDEHGQSRANFAVADILGVDYKEEVTKYAGRDGPGIYLQSSGHPLTASLGPHTVGILTANVSVEPAFNSLAPAFCQFVRVQGSAESIMDYRLPYLVPNLDKHILDSWNAAPPGDVKIPGAATVNTYGRGKAVYIGVPIFRKFRPAPNLALIVEPLYWINTFVRGIIDQFVPSPPLRITSRGSTQAGFYRKGKNELVIQIVNSGIWASKGTAEPRRNVEIIGRSDRFSIRSARTVWPKEQPLDIANGEEWRVRVPEVEFHTIVMIDLR